MRNVENRVPPNQCYWFCQCYSSTGLWGVSLVLYTLICSRIWRYIAEKGCILFPKAHDLSPTQGDAGSTLTCFAIGPKEAEEGLQLCAERVVTCRVVTGSVPNFWKCRLQDERLVCRSKLINTWTLWKGNLLSWFFGCSWEFEGCDLGPTP